MLLEPRFFFLKKVSPSIESILKSRLRFGIRTIKGYSNSHPFHSFETSFSLSLLLPLIYVLFYSLSISHPSYIICPFTLVSSDKRVRSSSHVIVFPLLYSSVLDTPPPNAFIPFLSRMFNTCLAWSMRKVRGGMCWLGGVYFFYQFYTP